MIVFHAADLLWATRIKATAEAVGIPARPVRNTEMLAARLADSPVRALIVDLDAPDTAIELIRAARASTHPIGKELGPIRILAFGPHVAVESFQAAKTAGADTLMARGAFNARLADILRRLGSDAAPALIDRIED